MVLTGLERDRDRGGTGCSRAVKAAVHWERPGCAFTQSSPNLTLAAMWLHADSARLQRVSGSARTDSRSASARNPIAAHAKFGDDSELNALTRTQWTAAFSALGCTYTRLQTVWSLPGHSRQANKDHNPRCHRRPNGPGQLADKVAQPTTQSAKGCTRRN